MTELENKNPKNTNKIGSESFWRQHHEACTMSGLSRARYCRQHQLVYYRFLYWCRKFDSCAVSKNEYSSIEKDFLRVQLQPEESSGAHTRALCTLEINKHHRLLIHTANAIDLVLNALSRRLC